MASELGAYLRECRHKTFASAREVSLVLEKTDSYICAIESGRSIPSYETMCALVPLVGADKDKALKLWKAAKVKHLKAREARYWAKVKEGTK